MEDLSFESIIAILAFWLVLISGFVMLICRLKMKSANVALHQSTSSASPSYQRDPKRIIQIYYIGNLDSNTTSASSTHDILNKVMARIEDHPPSYQEALSNDETSIYATNEEELPAMSRSSSSTHLPPQATDASQRVNNDVVVLMIERNGDAACV